MLSVKQALLADHDFILCAITIVTLPQNTSTLRRIHLRAHEAVTVRSDTVKDIRLLTAFPAITGLIGDTFCYTERWLTLRHALPF